MPGLPTKEAELQIKNVSFTDHSDDFACIMSAQPTLL